MVQKLKHLKNYKMKIWNYKLFTFSSMFLLLIFLCSNQGLNAQVDDYAKDKAERAERRTKNRADNEVNRAVDKEVDKAFSKVKGLFKKKNKSKKKKGDVEQEEVEQEVENDGFSFPGMKRINIDKQYEFGESFVYDITTIDGKKGKEKSEEFELLIPESKHENYMSFQPTDKDAREDGFMVWDLDKKAMLMLDTKRKSGTYTEYEGLMERAIENQMEEQGTYTVRKTGNDGTMLGMRYEEYEMASDEMNGLVWVTKAYNYNMFGMLNQSMKNAPFSASGVDQEAFDGLIIKTENTDLESGDRHIMVLKAINRTDLKVNAGEYEIIDMSGLLNGQK
jgi:hypothetical protein